MHGSYHSKESIVGNTCNHPLIIPKKNREREIVNGKALDISFIILRDS